MWLYQFHLEAISSKKLWIEFQQDIYQRSTTMTMIGALALGMKVGRAFARLRCLSYYSIQSLDGFYLSKKKYFSQGYRLNRDRLSNKDIRKDSIALAVPAFVSFSGE